MSKIEYIHIFQFVLFTYIFTILFYWDPKPHGRRLDMTLHPTLSREARCWLQFSIRALFPMGTVRIGTSHSCLKQLYIEITICSVHFSTYPGFVTRRNTVERMRRMRMSSEVDERFTLSETTFGLVRYN